MTEQTQQHPIEVWLRGNKSTFELALANKDLTFDPFMAAVIQDCIRTPKLLQVARANPNSLKEALLACANAGLLPGSAYDQFYLVPFGNRIQGITGYKGMCDVAYRHPRVHSVEAFVVYEDETFRFEPGRGELTHLWNPEGDRSDGKIVAAYARATLTDPKGQHVVDKPVYWVMTRKEIDTLMRRSQAYRNAERKGKDSPWHTDYPKMARKTVLRALMNGGAVPRHHTLAPLLIAEADMDAAPPAAQPDEPQPDTRTDQLKQKLGVEIPDEQESE